MNEEGIVDSIESLDKKTQYYVGAYKPEVQAKYDGMLNGDNDYSNGIGVVHPLRSEPIQIKELEINTYKKCAALRFINKNQHTHLTGITPYTFIRHIDISDESDDNDNHTKKDIMKLKKQGMRCTSYAVDNSWILD
jgi:hypothetical protein